METQQTNPSPQAGPIPSEGCLAATSPDTTDTDITMPRPSPFQLISQEDQLDSVIAQLKDSFITQMNELASTLASASNAHFDKLAANMELLNWAGVTDWDCHEYCMGLPCGLPYGYVPRSDKIR